ncbi:MAG: hypothetical protein QOI20_1879 [Acidimicrobiaceae bacterium]|jgi:LPXTG-motif cell wall-anchored protein|nr:hypothetical protein [Acidimicrobiaceae bacterium]
MMKRRLKAVLGGLLFVGALAVPAAAHAEDYVGNGPQVIGNQFSRGDAPPAVAPATQGRGLPITGSDVAGLTAIGLAAVGTGTVLVRRSRRSHTA